MSRIQRKDDQFVLNFEAADATTGLSLANFDLNLKHSGTGVALSALELTNKTWTEVGNGVYRITADHSLGREARFFGNITHSSGGGQWIPVPEHEVVEYTNDEIYDMMPSGVVATADRQSKYDDLMVEHNATQATLATAATDRATKFSSLTADIAAMNEASATSVADQTLEMVLSTHASNVIPGSLGAVVQNIDADLAAAVTDRSTKYTALLAEVQTSEADVIADAATNLATAAADRLARYNSLSGEITASETAILADAATKETAAVADRLARHNNLVNEIVSVQSNVMGDITSAETTIMNDITSAETLLSTAVSNTEAAVIADIATAETTIMADITSAETTIMADISSAETTLDAAITAAQGAIIADVGSAETTVNAHTSTQATNIMSELGDATYGLSQIKSALDSIEAVQGSAALMVEHPDQMDAPNSGDEYMRVLIYATSQGAQEDLDDLTSANSQMFVKLTHTNPVTSVVSTNAKLCDSSNVALAAGPLGEDLCPGGQSSIYTDAEEFVKATRVSLGIYEVFLKVDAGDEGVFQLLCVGWDSDPGSTQKQVVRGSSLYVRSGQRSHGRAVGFAF